MGHDPEQYPKTNVGDLQPELIWRHCNMFNLHINAHKMRWLKDVVDIQDRHEWIDDFCQDLDAAIRWTVETSEQGSGSASYGCTDLVNGVLLITNDGADDDNVEISNMCECWKLIDCYPFYAEIRFKISDAIQSDFWFGLITGNTFFTPPNDYVVFKKDDGDANLDFANAINGAGNDTDTGIDLANLTWYRLGIHWDGAGTIRWFVIQDGNFPQTILATGTVTTSIVQDEELKIGFGIQNGEAAAKSLYVDYVKCVQKRVIE